MTNLNFSKARTILEDYARKPVNDKNHRPSKTLLETQAYAYLYENALKNGYNCKYEPIKNILKFSSQRIGVEYSSIKKKLNKLNGTCIKKETPPKRKYLNPKIQELLDEAQSLIEEENMMIDIYNHIKELKEK